MQLTARVDDANVLRRTHGTRMTEVVFAGSELAVSLTIALLHHPSDGTRRLALCTQVKHSMLFKVKVTCVLMLHVVISTLSSVHESADDVTLTYVIRGAARTRRGASWCATEHGTVYGEMQRPVTPQLHGVTLTRHCCLLVPW